MGMKEESSPSNGLDRSRLGKLWQVGDRPLDAAEETWRPWWEVAVAAEAPFLKSPGQVRRVKNETIFSGFHPRADGQRVSRFKGGEWGAEAELAIRSC
jgi:hypothetical protein